MIISDVAYRQEVLRDRPTFYWPLDKTAYAEDYHLTASLFTGLINGTVTSSKGIINGTQGLSCSSTGTIYLPYNTTINNQVFTAECWVYHTTIGAQAQYIMFLSSDFSSNGWALLYYPAHNAYDFQAYGVNDVLSLKLPTLNQWNHLVCVSSGTSTYLYLNGILQGVSPFSLILASGATPYFSAGGINWPSTGSVNFNVLGNIAHMAYYNHVLPVNRITSHYKAGVYPQPNQGIRINYSIPIIQQTTVLQNGIGV